MAHPARPDSREARGRGGAVAGGRLRAVRVSLVIEDNHLLTITEVNVEVNNFAWKHVVPPHRRGSHSPGPGAGGASGAGAAERGGGFERARAREGGTQEQRG